MALLLVVEIIALAAVFVVHSLPCVADRAEELHKWAQARQGQAQQHTSTAAGERVHCCTAFALALQWSISQLTLVGITMC